MKTKLPTEIKSIDEAKKFLSDLYVNGEVYHPEDDAHDIVWNFLPESDVPTGEECDRLNKLMGQVYGIGLDPCEFVNELNSNIYKEN